MDTKPVLKNFRFAPTTVAQLEHLAQASGRSQVDVVRELVDREYRARMREEKSRKKSPPPP